MNRLYIKLGIGPFYTAIKTLNTVVEWSVSIVYRLSKEMTKLFHSIKLLLLVPWITNLIFQPKVVETRVMHH